MCHAYLHASINAPSFARRVGLRRNCKWCAVYIQKRGEKNIDFSHWPADFFDSFDWFFPSGITQTKFTQLFWNKIRIAWSDVPEFGIYIQILFILTTIKGASIWAIKTEMLIQKTLSLAPRSAGLPPCQCRLHLGLALRFKGDEWSLEAKQRAGQTALCR